MPFNTVADVNTAGVTIPYNQGDGRVYACPFADTLVAGDELPLTTGDIGMRITRAINKVMSHNGGAIPFLAKAEYDQSVSLLAGGDNSKVRELLPMAHASANGASNAKTAKVNTILADGSAYRNLAFVASANMPLNTEGAGQWDFAIPPIYEPVYVLPPLS
jgi:hypothetical protein